MNQLASITDISYYEHKQHGSPDFPYAVYYSAIPDFFPTYPLHWHEEMEIIIIIKGQCCISVNTQPFLLSEGDILFIYPGMLHSINQHEQDSAFYYNVIFNLSLLGNDSPADVCYRKYLQPYLNDALSVPFHLTKEHASYPPIYQVLHSLINLPIGISNELLIKARLFELFWYLYPLHENDGFTSDSVCPLSQIRKMKDLLLYISKNYAAPLSLKDAANYCGYSIPYFSKFFKSFTGKTLVTYINEYRLQQACHLLLTTRMNIIEISEEVGFDNHSYFIRLFQRTYNMTPKVFRQKNNCSDR